MQHDSVGEHALLFGRQQAKELLFRQGVVALVAPGAPCHRLSTGIVQFCSCLLLVGLQLLCSVTGSY